MLASYAIGLVATAVIAVAWAGVQVAWRKTFPADCSDPDVLASRPGCHGCDGAKECGLEEEHP